MFADKTGLISTEDKASYAIGIPLTAKDCSPDLREIAQEVIEGAVK